jgi:hypothetical protein
VRLKRVALGPLLFVLIGCDASTGLTSQAGARPCEVVHSSARCDAILVAGAADASVDPTTVTAVTLLPEPPPDGMIRGKSFDVRLTLADGTTRDATIFCGGISPAYLPECMQDPTISLSAPGNEGYRDLPENATPVPELDPAAMARAVPLLIPRLEVPIDGPGPKRIRLGEAALANGIIQEASFEIEGDWPAGVVVRNGSVRIDLVPVDGGAPIQNIYEHGWKEGVERVDVLLVFDSALVRPGASLVVLNLRVR